jgi:hypothetical protein
MDLHVVTGHRGILYLTIPVRGRSTHTTATDLGVTAIAGTARVGRRALGDRSPRRPGGTWLDLAGIGSSERLLSEWGTAERMSRDRNCGGEFCG